MNFKILLLTMLAAAVPLTAAAQDTTQGYKADTYGWHLPYIGRFHGDWSASVGLSFWTDELNFRNLQLRADMDLAPGLRYHTVVRSNRKLNSLGGFKPHFDENYLEAYAFNYQPEGTLSASLRIGTVRYLHFPYPDRIAMFDQVPGVSDLESGRATGYSGQLWTVDYAHKSGLGLHYTGIRWDFARHGEGTGILEGYAYYRQRLAKIFDFEYRYGRLAIRPEPLGRSDIGHSAYLGVQAQAYSVGVLYEKIKNMPTYTGVMVTLPLDKITAALGTVNADYARSPERIGVQLPLVKGYIGGVKTKAPRDAVKVGEVKARRVRTYWQASHVRNYYEHRLSVSGETGDGLIVVAKESPWYLQAEALVSPHTFNEGLKTWERDRQGPAQVVQDVTYSFYKPGKVAARNEVGKNTLQKKEVGK